MTRPLAVRRAAAAIPREHTAKVFWLEDSRTQSWISPLDSRQVRRSRRIWTCLLVLAHGILPLPQGDVRTSLVFDEPLLVATGARRLRLERPAEPPALH
jgi:hypothetical protein